MKCIDVDFNVRGLSGTVKAATRSSGLTLIPGERVICIDRAEPDMAFRAVVHSVRDDGTALLDVDWSSPVGVP